MLKTKVISTCIIGIFCTIHADPITSINGLELPIEIMDAIKNNECLIEYNQCNPNAIRINKRNDIEKARELGLITKGAHVRCYNKEQCAQTAQFLINNGINNIDLGPYQINYYWNGKYELSGYFDLDIAESRAREILRGLILQYGYSWRTLARYHNYDSKNLSRNTNYFRKMQQFIGVPSNTKNVIAKRDKKKSNLNNQASTYLSKKQEKHDNFIVPETYKSQPSTYALKQENKLWSSGVVEIAKEPIADTYKIDVNNSNEQTISMQQTQGTKEDS